MKSCGFIALLFLCVCAQWNPAFSADSTPLDPGQSLQKLMEGNKRYVTAAASAPKPLAGRRAEVAKAQHPFAVIVGCSDSRVPPEIIFDQGLGDLFVIRLAGNVVDDYALESIGYALDHLGVPLVVVLGHKRCGAVGAAVESGKDEDHLAGIVKVIGPAVEQARGKEGDLWENSAKENALMTAARLQESKPFIAPLVKAGKVKVVAAYYDLDTGEVVFLK